MQLLLYAGVIGLGFLIMWWLMRQVRPAEVDEWGDGRYGAPGRPMPVSSFYRYEPGPTLLMWFVGIVGFVALVVP